MAYKIAILLWIIILFLTGSYIRIGASETVPVLDLLIIIEVLACGLGGLIGMFLIRTSNNRPTFGERGLLAFCFAGLLSACFSNYTRIVFGYWVLLFGSCLLTIGIMRQIKTQAQLNRIENIWLITITLILIKDLIISLLLPGLQEPYAAAGPTRLGMGVTTPAVMSLLATLCFWISFKKQEVGKPFFLWMVRAFYVAIIILAKTRVSFVCFFVAAIARLWFYLKPFPFTVKVILPVSIIVALLLGTFVFYNEAQFNTAFVRLLNRSQEVDTLATLTGRTEIWPYALRRVLNDGVLSLSFGHGYGVSRFIINEGTATPSFYAKHAHNTFLEILLTMGLLGIITFTIMLIYSLKFLMDFDSLRQTFSDQFLLRAVTVIAITLVYSLTESYLGMKIGPIAISYIVYLLALDRRHFLKA